MYCIVQSSFQACFKLLKSAMHIRCMHGPSLVNQPKIFIKALRTCPKLATSNESLWFPVFCLPLSFPPTIVTVVTHTLSLCRVFSCLKIFLYCINAIYTPPRKSSTNLQQLSTATQSTPRKNCKRLQRSTYKIAGQTGPSPLWIIWAEGTVRGEREGGREFFFFWYVLSSYSLFLHLLTTSVQGEFGETGGRLPLLCAVHT